MKAERNFLKSRTLRYCEIPIMLTTSKPPRFAGQSAVIAAIRHRHTTYDRLLMQGWDRMDARDAVHDDIERVLGQWRQS